MNKTRHREESASPCLVTCGVRGIFRDAFTTFAQRAIKDAEEQNAVAYFIFRLSNTHRELAKRQASLGGTHKSEMR
jgi:hypothetical protein